MWSLRLGVLSTRVETSCIHTYTWHRYTHAQSIHYQYLSSFYFLSVEAVVRDWVWEDLLFSAIITPSWTDLVCCGGPAWSIVNGHGCYLHVFIQIHIYYTHIPTAFLVRSVLWLDATVRLGDWSFSAPFAPTGQWMHTRQSTLRHFLTHTFTCPLLHSRMGTSRWYKRQRSKTVALPIDRIFLAHALQSA